MPALDFSRALPRPDRDEELSLAEELARGVGGWTLPRRGSKEMLQAYGKTPWLHATVRRRAEAVGAVEWVLYRPGKDINAPPARLRGIRHPRPPGDR